LRRRVDALDALDALDAAAAESGVSPLVQNISTR